MNKQQLAAKIWASANKMRSKIEANEYKDFILGFIFYKFLSEKEEQFLKSQGMTDEDLPLLTEEDDATVEFCQQNIGYFIEYKNLFSTWLAMGHDFDIDNVRTALSAFDRLIGKGHEKVFDDIFNTLQTGLSKLGSSAAAQTKAVSDLIRLIDDIPMDGKQDYDALGYIYEYLIEKFASNAGKKAGEFYTPHEVSELMAEIVADHLSGKQNIEIYDPTSGSGSLLITIGQAVARHGVDAHGIKYYAQELKAPTYNLTRMNLVMRGISPSNIETRNDDTLERDWPWFDDKDPEGTYKPLFVDAVVSNPPYSQNWDSEGKGNDPRFADYGLAPKSKADYAFLLHDLYHLRSDGVMAIVLPHGVLFRGDQEGQIRRNLVENHNIEAIIGLPANIFFGTGIPTIIMVLRKPRSQDDPANDGSVLIVDASKGFVKDGKNNKLRASDIKRIADVVRKRRDVEKFARVVSLEEIRANDYNLNIPRYVDSSDDVETWDIYSTMFGGVPRTEVDALARFWEVFPSLRGELFEEDGGTLILRADDVASVVEKNADVEAYQARFARAFEGLGTYLYDELVDETTLVHVPSEEERLSREIFLRLEGVPLIDKYAAYQVLDDQWQGISEDLEVIQSEGFEAVKLVDPNMVQKKKDGREYEEQDKKRPWKGRIIPFDLVQETLLVDERAELDGMEGRITEIDAALSGIVSEMSEEELESDFVKEGGEELDLKAVPAALDRVLAEQDEELAALLGYMALLDAKADDGRKLDYVDAHPQVNWGAMKSQRNGAYAKKAVATRIGDIKASVEVAEDSLAGRLKRANALGEERTQLEKQAKKARAELDVLTKETIESMTDDHALVLLGKKWVDPLVDRLSALSDDVIGDLKKQVKDLCEKYATTLPEIDRQIDAAERELYDLLGELVGDDRDMAGLEAFRELLSGGSRG